MTRRAALVALLALGGGTAAAVAAIGTPDPARGGGWDARAPSIVQRTEVGAARIGDSIYVVGGFVPPSGETTGRLLRYDVPDDEWTELRVLPRGVNHPGVTAQGGRLYVYGGFRNDAGEGRRPSDDLWRYRPGTNGWRHLPDSATKRGAMAFAAIGDRLYAAGGANNETDELRRLEIYDISERDWRRGTPMEVGRNHVAAAVVDHDLYVLGGRPGPIHGGLRVVERYDPQDDRWRRLPGIPTARSGFAAVVAGDRIVVFGGEELDGGSTIEQVELFDPMTRNWSDLPDMVTARHGLGGASRGHRVFALEGGPMPGLFFSNANESLAVP